ncbi:pectate lyase superfamily protein-domain-containing protein [Mycena olivaceomarginata]|nr:pectate lyase superfamily protein-domain-containing protein [Mycena olivaceomarginata]
MRSIPSCLTLLACASRAIALGSSCSAPLGPGGAAAGDPYWMQTIPRQGSSPLNPNPTSYKVFRDVTAAPYFAKGDGTTDDTDAINRAISDMGRCGNLTCQSSSVEPALVYFPAGKYLVTKPITPYYYTALWALFSMSEISKALPISSLEEILSVSSPVSPAGIAIIDADVYSGAQAPAGGWNCPSTDNEWVSLASSFNQSNGTIDLDYSRSIRNFVIDTTNIPADQFGTGIHWQVGQATSLINLEFQLSTASGNKHQGIFMENGSGGFMADLTINGGAFGLWISNQQFTIQNVKITNADTAIFQQWNWGFTFKNIVISGCRIGFGLNTNGQTEATQSAGSVTILDSSISASVAAVQTNTDQSVKLGGALMLQNVDLNGSPVGVVDGANNMFLQGGGTVNQFILGNEYSGNSSTGQYNKAASPGPDLPSQLLDASSSNNGVFFRTRPQYENYSPSPSVNDVKPEFASAKSNGVKCDGTSDDTVNLQNFIDKRILLLSVLLLTNCEVLDLDAGTCIVSSTIKIPTVPVFSDASNPQPVLQVGNPGDKGSVEISDIVVFYRWRVCRRDLHRMESHRGCWGGRNDVHVRIGGAIGTKIQEHSSDCTSLDLDTLRMFGSGRRTMNLDDPGQGRINSFTARGIFIDHAPGPVWLVGTRFGARCMLSIFQVFYQYSIVGSQRRHHTISPTPAPPTPFSTNADWDDPSWGNSGSAWALTISQSSNVYVYGAGLYSFFVSTVSKWAATKTTPNQPSGTPVGCPSLQTQAVAAMKLLFSPDGGWYDRGICGHWPEPGTSSPGLSAQEWTNVNTFETLYNTMWQTVLSPSMTDYRKRPHRNPAVVPNEAHGSSQQLPVTRGFYAAWAGLMYLKVQQYNDAHGITESGKTPDTFYYVGLSLSTRQKSYTSLFGRIKLSQSKKGIAKTWLASSGCGGGVLAQYKDSDGTLRQNAQLVADWYTKGKGTTLRDVGGLWFDSQSSDCTGPNHNVWTYNQGPILSGMGAMATLTGDQSYIDFALKTVDAVVNAGTVSGLLPQPTNVDKHLEVVDGNLAEGCDGADDSAHSNCDHDQQYYKGAFMKHLQYFLDNANNTVRDKYAPFVGEQASAVIHFATRSDGQIGEVWFAPDTGGSTYNYKTLTAGLDALNCAQKKEIAHGLVNRGNNQSKRRLYNTCVTMDLQERTLTHSLDEYHVC